MGGGTGANLEAVGPSLSTLRQATVVDLSPSLLKVADQRVKDRGWTNVRTEVADATAWQPPEQVDVVTFSYSLTMIPDWFAAIDNAYRMLKPGGLIGVVDFYVARKYPETGRKSHRWFTRIAVPAWFHTDNVFLTSDHVPYLHRKFEPVSFHESSSRIPYLPFHAPYYRFVGRKPVTV
jgi:S-adenosylmethionine-diacylgycerolhomoserine-N-methlytransferase